MPRQQRPASEDPRDIAMFVDSRLDTLRADLLAHIDRRFEEQRRHLLAAFPDHDIHGHNQWHKARQQKEIESRELGAAVKRYGLIGAVGTAALWNWNAIVGALKELVRSWLR